MAQQDGSRLVTRGRFSLLEILEIDERDQSLYSDGGGYPLGHCLARGSQTEDDGGLDRRT